MSRGPARSSPKAFQNSAVQAGRPHHNADEAMTGRIALAWTARVGRIPARDGANPTVAAAQPIRWS